MSRTRMAGIVLFFLVPLSALALSTSTALNAASWVLIIAIVSIILSFFIVPVLYRRKLEQRDPKSLSRFLLSDPEMRDLILKKKDAAGKKDDKNPGTGPAG